VGSCADELRRVAARRLLGRLDDLRTEEAEEAMHAAFASEARWRTIADMPNYKAGSRVSVVSEAK
jgi:hypothetical protein